MNQKSCILLSCILLGLLSCEDDEKDGLVNDHIKTTYSIVVPEMVGVKGCNVVGGDTTGVFVIGRNVTISDFSISKYLVTREFYFKTMYDDKEVNAWPSSCEFDAVYEGSIAEGEIDSLRPVETVSWYDAVYFCNRLSKIHGFKPVYTICDINRDSTKSIISASVTQNLSNDGYRLPTEAEWEFAARGGDITAPDWNFYYSGADSESAGAVMDSAVDAVGWYNCNAATGVTTGRNPSTMHGTHQVGLKKANRLGIYDMSGNLFEWCWDWKSVNTEVSSTNPVGPATGEEKVLRGGSWLHGWALYCGVRSQLYSDPKRSTNYYGFRIVRSR